MRIVHVTDAFLPRMGGIERQVDSLSRRQALRGDDVTVACTVASPAADPEGDPRKIRRPAGWTGTQMAHHRARHLVNEIDFGDVDLVHAHVSVFSPLATLALRRAAQLGVPAVATVHSLWTPVEGLAIRFGREAGLLGNDHTVWTAVSSVTAETVARRLNVTVDVLPNGVESAFWSTARPPRPPRVFHIATVMRLVGRKRPLPFIAMVAALRKAMPAEQDLRVTIVGDGPQRSAVAKAVRRLGLQSTVSLEGQLPSSGIRDVFAEADVYVAPARHESFGIAALEAHCAGLPVVGLAASGVADIVTHTRDGCLVRDDAGVVAALARMAAAPRQAAAAVGGSVYDWSAVLGRTDDVYGRATRRAGVRQRASQPVPR